MSGERTDPPTVEDEPLSADPVWRDDAERTIDADPAWIADLRDDAGRDDSGHRDDDHDDDRTIDVDADLLEHVRAAARAARERLAGPPRPEEAVVSADVAEPGPDVEPHAASDIEPTPAADAGPGPAAAGPWSPPPPGGTTSWLLAAVEHEPVRPPEPASVAPAAPVAVPPPTPSPIQPIPADPLRPVSGGRWQPPPRLRPAEVRPATPLVVDQPGGRHLDRRWALVGIAVAAVVGFLIALAVAGGGDDAPDPSPGATTVPGASTTVSTP